MSKLNKKAIDEIVELLEKVNEVIKLMDEFSIHITSDPWRATSFSDHENILSWRRKDFEEIEIKNIDNEPKFYVGGNIVTGGEHEYKDKWIIAPKKLAIAQGEIFEQYLKCIIKSTSLKHFELKFEDHYGLLDNCGWEHYMCITATIKDSALTKMTLDEYINNELGCAPERVKNKFKCEALEFYTMLKDETVLTDEPCNDWYELCIKGHGDLDIWIHGYYPIFNPSRLAMCVYKLWAKEVLINE